MGISSRRTAATLVVAFLLVMGFARTSSASPVLSVEYLETSLGGGLFQYDYTIRNLTDSIANPTDARADLYWLTLSFSPEVSLVSAVTAANWDLIAGEGFADTFSLQPGSAPVGSDLAPGQLLTGLELVVNDEIGSAGFQALFTNIADLNNPLVYEGQTTPALPAPVPEPGSLLLVASAIASLYGASRKLAVRAAGRPTLDRFNGAWRTDRPRLQPGRTDHHSPVERNRYSRAR